MLQVDKFALLVLTSCRDQITTDRLTNNSPVSLQSRPTFHSKDRRFMPMAYLHGYS